jgi:hypothetical protein
MRMLIRSNWTSQADEHNLRFQGGGRVTALSTGPVYSSPTEGSSPLVDQITGSLGSLQLAEDGQLRFYGATSNLYLLIKGTPRSANTQGLTHPSEVQAVLQAAGVGQTVDAELEENLIRLYLCWEDPSIHLVQEEIFYRERERCKSGYGTNKLYSEVLVTSMCAVGASFTSRHCETLPETLVEFFASRARALLDVELDSPTLSTVQSLGILSGVESIRTLDARGWLHSGMAVRLATDLGLHLDSQIYLDAGIIDHEKVLARRVVFWGAFIHERMWSLYLGRPVSLNENSITTPPYVVRVTEQKYWQPYIDDCEDSIFPQLRGHFRLVCYLSTREYVYLSQDHAQASVGELLHQGFINRWVFITKYQYFSRHRDEHCGDIGIQKDKGLDCIYSGFFNTDPLQPLNTEIKTPPQVPNINAQLVSRVMNSHSAEDETTVSAPEPGLVRTNVGEMGIRKSEHPNPRRTRWYPQRCSAYELWEPLSGTSRGNR